jgi:uncharacterized protein (TIGR03437 family)
MRIELCIALFSAVAAWAADPAPPVAVSAASPTVGIAADSLASVFGSQLATVTAQANSLPWPTTLGDMPFVYITDSTSRQQTASLSYVSPSQMNLWIPAGVAAGPATISFPVTGLPQGVGTAALRSVPVTIQRVAPGLFSADGTGTGVAAASAVSVAIPTQIQNPVTVFACGSKGCAAAPINVGIDRPVYLTLYATGFRGASSPESVVVTIGSTTIKPTYAGPQMEVPGLDQVNVPLPLTLRGAGLVNVTVTVDGVPSNAVQINIQ